MKTFQVTLSPAIVMIDAADAAYPAVGQGALRSSSYTIHRGCLGAILKSGCILELVKIRKSAHFSNYENCAPRALCVSFYIRTLTHQKQRAFANSF